MSTAKSNIRAVLRHWKANERHTMPVATDRRIPRGIFPKSVHPSSRAVGWLKSDVDEWVAPRRLGSEPTDGVKR